MDIDSIKIGGLYSCYHPLEVWERCGGGNLSIRHEDMETNKPFVVLEVDDHLLEYCDIYQLKILTTDGLIYWIDVGKSNLSIQPVLCGS
jgi:hypothetical protein